MIPYEQRSRLCLGRREERVPDELIMLTRFSCEGLIAIYFVSKLITSQAGQGPMNNAYNPAVKINLVNRVCAQSIQLVENERPTTATFAQLRTTYVRSRSNKGLLHWLTVFGRNTFWSNRISNRIFAPESWASSPRFSCLSRIGLMRDQRCRKQ